MRISKFIGSLLIAMISFSAFSQNQETSKDTAEIKVRRYGLRAGIDLYKLTRGMYEDGYKGIELVGDYRISPKYFIAAELGNEKLQQAKDRIDFTAKGSYIKVGFDYNAYENWLDMENVTSIGLRYGFSSFSQTLNAYKIYNRNPYFGEETWIESGQEFSGLSAHWLEIVAGIKVEVLNNIYVGFSARINYLLTQKEPTNFSSLYIPGFHRTYDGKFGVGFNYTVSYFIPIYKTKTAIKK